MGVPARRISVASEEAAAPPGPDDREVAFLADVALPDVVLFPQGRLDLLPDRLAVRLERFEDLAEHLLGFPDDVFAGADAGRDSLHVGFEVRRHLRLGDSLRVILQRLDDRSPARRGPGVLALDELAVVELLEDLVSRGFRPQAEALHLLDEGPFAVPPRRFRPVLPERHGARPLKDLVHGERRQNGLSHDPVRIVLAPPEFLDSVAFRQEHLASQIDLGFGGLRDRIGRHRGQEAAHDELVDPPMVLPLQFIPSVASVRPRLGTMRSWPASSRASAANGDSLSFSRTDRRLTVDGYTVLSVRG